MKKELQPTMHRITVKCESCGETFETNSTKTELRVDVCSQCHPFYTGKLTSNSKAGRIERFNNKFAKKA